MNQPLVQPFSGSSAFLGGWHHPGLALPPDTGQQEASLLHPAPRSGGSPILRPHPGPPSLPLQGRAWWGQGPRQRDPGTGTHRSRGRTSRRGRVPAPPRERSAPGSAGPALPAQGSVHRGALAHRHEMGRRGEGWRGWTVAPRQRGGAGASVAEQRPPRGVGVPAPPPRPRPRRALPARGYSPPGGAGPAAGRQSTWPRHGRCWPPPPLARALPTEAERAWSRRGRGSPTPPRFPRGAPAPRPQPGFPPAPAPRSRG